MTFIFNNDTKFEFKCDHKITCTIQSSVLCVKCGEEVNKQELVSQEWVNHSTPGKITGDRSRVVRRPVYNKNIHSELQDMGIPDHIITKANELFKEATHENIKRGKRRKSILFACVYFAINLEIGPFPPNHLFKIFRIHKKLGLRGIKDVTLGVSKDSPIFSIDIDPFHYISYFMNGMRASLSEIDSVKSVYDKIVGKCDIFKRSRPMSIAAGLIFYWLKVVKLSDVTVKTFSKQIEVSELTINKIYRVVKTCTEGEME